MKILQIHNIYIGKTGEETVIEEERRILEKHGHDVAQFIKDNSDLQSFSKLKKLRMYGSLLHSKEIGKELTAFIDKEKPEICHVHNTFPIITPIVYEVCRSKGLPVVQTLHNYKMICTNSLLFRKGEVCEKCLNKNLFNSIKYKCYRNSYLATAAQAGVIQYHRNKGTWNNLIDKYVCLTEFQKNKLISGGLGSEKITVKPNFISESGLTTVRENFFLFVGKVDDYKGLQDLLHLFRRNQESEFIVIGKSDKPEIFDDFKNVCHLGEREKSEVLEHMRKCKAVIFPSKYYEGMPMVILEAFSHRKPVISRDRGAMSSMIKADYNGIKYNDPEELVQVVKSLDNDPEFVNALGENAYRDYRENYSDEQGYQNLMNLYNSVLQGNTNDQG